MAISNEGKVKRVDIICLHVRWKLFRAKIYSMDDVVEESIKRPRNTIKYDIIHKNSLQQVKHTRYWNLDSPKSIANIHTHCGSKFILIYDTLQRQIISLELTDIDMI